MDCSTLSARVSSAFWAWDATVVQETVSIQDASIYPYRSGSNPMCMGQSNPRGRNHQVAHMGRIYSGASMVHSWLDKADPDPEFIELGLVNDATNLSDLQTLTV